jgi:hypothetical protein
LDGREIVNLLMYCDEGGKKKLRVKNVGVFECVCRFGWIIIVVYEDCDVM